MHVQLRVLPAIMIVALAPAVTSCARDEPVMGGDRIVVFGQRSVAMEPTLKTGTDIQLREFHDVAAAVPSVRRGDIIAYLWPPDTTKRFVHRPVGLPGDTLSMAGGVLQVNGRMVPEPYAWREGSGADSANKDLLWQREFALVPDTAAYNPGRADWGPLRIPEGYFFVLGDNRDNSLDSRWWGLLPVGHLRGIVEHK